MADESGTGPTQPQVARRPTRLTEQRAQLLDELAQRAEEIARVAERSAEVHEQLPPHLLNPPDHAERERSLAAAERAAAEAYRAHRVPPDDVRAAIVKAGEKSTSGSGGEPSSPPRQAESSPDA